MPPNSEEEYTPPGDAPITVPDFNPFSALGLDPSSTTQFMLRPAWKQATRHRHENTVLQHPETADRFPKHVQVQQAYEYLSSGPNQLAAARRRWASVPDVVFFNPGLPIGDPKVFMAPTRDDPDSNPSDTTAAANASTPNDTTAAGSTTTTDDTATAAGTNTADDTATAASTSTTDDGDTTADTATTSNMPDAVHERVYTQAEVDEIVAKLNAGRRMMDIAMAGMSAELKMYRSEDRGFRARMAAMEAELAAVDAEEARNIADAVDQRHRAGPVEDAEADAMRRLAEEAAYRRRRRRERGGSTASFDTDTGPTFGPIVATIEAARARVAARVQATSRGQGSSRGQASSRAQATCRAQAQAAPRTQAASTSTSTPAHSPVRASTASASASPSHSAPRASTASPPPIIPQSDISPHATIQHGPLSGRTSYITPPASPTRIIPPPLNLPRARARARAHTPLPQPPRPILVGEWLNSPERPPHAVATHLDHRGRLSFRIRPHDLAGWPVLPSVWRSRTVGFEEIRLVREFRGMDEAEVRARIVNVHCRTMGG